MHIHLVGGFRITHWFSGGICWRALSIVDFRITVGQDITNEMTIIIYLEASEVSGTQTTETDVVDM